MHATIWKFERKNSQGYHHAVWNGATNRPGPFSVPFQRPATDPIIPWLLPSFLPSFFPSFLLRSFLDSLSPRVGWLTSSLVRSCMRSFVRSFIYSPIPFFARFFQNLSLLVFIFFCSSCKEVYSLMEGVDYSEFFETFYTISKKFNYRLQPVE